MLGGGTQKSLRKAVGAIKDSTTVNLAKANSDYKELDIAIVKSTNHVERLAKEKHIRAIFAAILVTRPRADVAYCIHALARQLSKTHNWALKFFGSELNYEMLFFRSALTLIWCGHAASMVNRVSCDRKQSDSSVAELTSDTVIEVSIEIPFAFRPILVQAIESTGTQVLEQILRIMLPCFMAQEGLSPLNFYIEDEFHHATHGGARGVKSITNYVPSQHDELEAKFFEERASFETK
ncbi:putative clathrin assembly protein [Camellia lanceoleosa]|uniref:Clathrin assembly protein n=1 Tax=Camellia lanceoleosa TaxID=1840588 RepID=A0ACC0J2K1_9ERIC|nr:putative clathrin assembly protein [Camellia lanceoleosa]